MNFSDVGNLMNGRKNLELNGTLKVGRFIYKKRIPFNQKQLLNLTR
jgi:hypothetical protein